MRYSLILLVALFTTACEKPLSALKEPIPQPLPYHFSISSIIDSRAVQAPHENLNAHPLDRNQFSAAIYNQLPRTLFATLPAKVKVDIAEYTTTEHAGIHALSYAINLSAHDTYGREILPSTPFICSETMERGFYAHKLALSAYRGESLANAQQSANIFQDLINTCIQRTMTSFTNAVIAAAE